MTLSTPAITASCRRDLANNSAKKQHANNHPEKTFQIVPMYKPALTALLLFVFTSTLPAQPNLDEQLLHSFHSIRCEEMAEWMEILCSDEMNGRLAGTPEYMLAAGWVASKFEEWGILPAGDDGSYFQMFDQPYTVVHDVGELMLHLEQPDGRQITKRYHAPADYYPGMNSGSGTVTAEVVFAGYGVTAPELGYDDYAGIDVSGKIVLVNRDVPYKDFRDPHYAEWLEYVYHSYKLQNAARHGAAGFLYIDGNSANPNTTWLPSLIVAGIGSEPLEDIFAGTGHTHAGLIALIDSTFQPRSFNTGKVMTISAHTTHHPEGRTANVIGLIEGADPALRDEVIILGAHLDAVGNAGGLLVRGGLDNASGVVNVMAAAKALATSEIPLKRSVMFLLFGAEEVGLVGSEFYVQNPLFTKEKTVTLINLDMAGNGTGLGVWADYHAAGLLDYFSAANERFIHRPLRALSAEQPVTNWGRPRTDAAMFERYGFRTVSIWTTGRVKPVFYHIPGDDADAVTIDIMEDIAKMLYLSVIEMANDDGLNLD